MVTKVRSTTFGKAFVALLLTACYGCSRSKAHHESEFVHREPAGATYVRGMTYRRTGAGPRSPESDQGWGGSKIAVGIAAGKAEFAFILLRHRSGRDVYRVTRTIWPERGKPIVDTTEFSYAGEAVTFFDDDVGRATLRPPTPKP